MSGKDSPIERQSRSVIVLENVPHKVNTEIIGDGLSETPAQVEFDDLLPHIGEFGRYQQLLFLLMIPFTFFLVFVYFAQIFITLVPAEYFCRIPMLANHSLESR